MPEVEDVVAGLTSLKLGELGEVKQAIYDRFEHLGESELTPAAVVEMSRLAGAAETVGAAEVAEERALAASGTPRAGSVRRMAAARAGQAVERSPEATGGVMARPVLTASAALRGLAGPVEDREQFFKAMALTLTRLDRAAPARGDVLLASATWEYPEERRLTEDQARNWQLLDAVTHPAALTASGGICAPVNVDYAVPVWASADRPLRDGLPAFQATRGGLRYVTPPDIATWMAATSVWSEATDANPAGASKPVVSMSCAAEQLVYADAVPTRLGFGNMQGRFAPEQVAANVDLAMAAAARVAENNLLAKIAAACVADVTSATVVGATRDLLTVVDQVSAGYRYLHRLPRTLSLTAIFPVWLMDLIRADLAREAAHQQDSSWNSLAITDDQIDGLLRAHGVNPIWHMDGQAASGGTYPLQGFAAQSPSGAVNTFPQKVVWYLFAEGQMQYLDGGRLDLGVVRDSTLDATNDFELFVEVFESVAFRGFTSGALQMVSTLCANGTTAGTVSTSGSCA